MDKVSIIIPTHNRIKQLYKAIDSCLKQTYKNIEVIVVNDHRETKNEVVNLISSMNDYRVRLFENERNKGGCGARNTGILKSKGKYISFLDDDDEYMPSKVSKSLEFLCDNPLFSGCVSKVFECRYSAEILTKGRKLSIDDVLSGKNIFAFGSNLFIRNSISEDKILWDENLRRYQDIEYVIRVIREKNVGILDNKLVMVNGHNGNPPGFIVENEFNKLRSIIQSDLENLEEDKRKKIIAQQYRDLAYFFGSEKNTKKMIAYLSKSLRTRLLPIRRYGCFFKILIKIITSK